MARARIRDMENYPNISTSARMVFAVFCDYQDEHGQAFPSLATVGKLAGLAERQVRRHVNTLIGDGWMSPVTRREGGRNHATIYQLHREPKPGHNHVRLSAKQTRTQSCPPLNPKPGHKPGHFKQETRTFQALNPDIAMSAEVLEVFEVREERPKLQPVPDVDKYIADLKKQKGLA